MYCTILYYRYGGNFFVKGVFGSWVFGGGGCLRLGGRGFVDGG